MRAGFVTCVELGLSCMEAIYEHGGKLDIAISLPDDVARKKSGRIYLDQFAAKHDLPLFKYRSINEPECLARIRSAKLDWLFIIGWSQIAGAELLSIPKRGALGIHPTLLPEGRGRAAIPWAIIKGLTRTGVTMFVLDEGVDTGDIVAQLPVPVDQRETATTLYKKIAQAHRTVIGEVWPLLTAGKVNPRPQDSALATYWPGRTPADGELHNSMSVADADRLVRATTHPYPGAFVRLPDSRILRVWAGSIAVGGRSPEGSTRLAFADGSYDATEFVIEG